MTGPPLWPDDRGAPTWRERFVGWRLNHQAVIGLAVAVTTVVLMQLDRTLLDGHGVRWLPVGVGALIVVLGWLVGPHRLLEPSSTSSLRRLDRADQVRVDRALRAVVRGRPVRLDAALADVVVAECARQHRLLGWAWPLLGGAAVGMGAVAGWLPERAAAVGVGGWAVLLAGLALGAIWLRRRFDGTPGLLIVGEVTR